MQTEKGSDPELITGHESKMNITMWDNVRVLSSPETDESGLAGKTGQVYGETTTSATSVEVIGEPKEDYALNVFFADLDSAFWFSPDLLELVDHAAGTEIVIGNLKAIRRADGSWEESEISPTIKWWQFWR